MARSVRTGANCGTDAMDGIRTELLLVHREGGKAFGIVVADGPDDPTAGLVGSRRDFVESDDGYEVAFAFVRVEEEVGRPDVAATRRL
jgi:hypothetical protein